MRKYSLQIFLAFLIIALSPIQSCATSLIMAQILMKMR
jgi:hypothetical protein